MSLPTLKYRSTFDELREGKEHSQEYKDALKSEHWKGIRKLAHERAKGMCEQCRKYPATSTHHKHYDTLGHERLEDVLALCDLCHIFAEEQRKEEQEERRWNNRVEAWAKKAFGSGWLRYPGPVVAESRFRAWLKKKGYKE